MSKVNIDLNDELTISYIRNELAQFKYLEEAKSVKSFFSRVDIIVRHLGFTGFSWAALTTSHDATATVGNIVQDLQRIYIEEEFHKFDFAVKHAMVSDDVILSSDIYSLINGPIQAPEFKRSRELLNLMERYGHHNYWNHAFDSHNGESRVLVAFGARNLNSDEFKRRSLKNHSKLVSLAKAIDQIGVRKYQTHFEKIRTQTKVKLHPKAARLLQSLADNKCKVAEAAREANMPQKTAERWISVAKDILGENTNFGLVLRAEKIGLINLE